MSVRSGRVDGEDDTIHTTGVCQDQMDHGLRFTTGIEQFHPTTSKSAMNEEGYL